MKKKYFIKRDALIVLVIILSITVACHSQVRDTSSNPLSISGMVDVNFNKNFNNPASHINDYRNFDIYENQFNLNFAKLVLQKSAEPVGFRIDLGFGQTMDIVNSDASLGGEKSLRNVEDAYLTAIVPWGNGLTINAGKLVTHMGGEVIETPQNINYSRSILFAYAIPFYHLGVSANYSFSDQFNATIYIYNGWNNVVENNKGKTLGAEISWSPSTSFTFIENWIGGPEETNNTKKRYVFDTIINYQANDVLFFTINADYGQEALEPSGVAVWKGAALTGKYSIDKNSYIGLRGEVYNDQTGFTTGLLQVLKEITLTYQYSFTNDLLTRLEFRRDWSNVDTFEDNSGTFTKNNQNTILIGSVYSF